MSRRLKDMRANARSDWYRIKAAADDAPDGAVQVMIYGEIGDSWWGDSVPAAQFARDLQAIDADAIDFHIHSPGGDVFDGLAIATAIRTHPAQTTAYVDGLAASAASFIAIAADEVVMAVGAQMMIHDAWGFALGNAADMAKMAADLDHVSANLSTLYALKAGGTADEWRDVMRAETWYTADEAVEAKLADRVDTANTVAAEARAEFDLSIFAHAGRQAAPDPWLPGRARATHTPPAEPADPSTPPKGADMLSDEFMQGLRERLGMSADAELSETVILAALDEALAEGAEVPTVAASAPEGTVLIDSTVLAELQASASQGRAARDQQVAEARASLVNAAVADGRISPARREQWLATLAADPGAEQTLAGLAKGLIPVVPSAGYTGGIDHNPDDDRASKLAGWEE